MKNDKEQTVILDDKNHRVFTEGEIVYAARRIEYDEDTYIPLNCVGIVIGEGMLYDLAVCFEIGTNDTFSIDAYFNEVKKIPTAVSND